MTVDARENAAIRLIAYCAFDHMSFCDYRTGSCHFFQPVYCFVASVHVWRDYRFRQPQRFDDVPDCLDK